MDIKQIKAELAAKLGFAIPNLQMVRQFEQDETTPAPWLSHWDNDHRVRVVMHEDVFKQIVADQNFNTLALKYEEIPATTERESYKRFVVITPRNIEATF